MAEDATDTDIKEGNVDLFALQYVFQFGTRFPGTGLKMVLRQPFKLSPNLLKLKIPYVWWGRG